MQFTFKITLWEDYFHNGRLIVNKLVKIKREEEITAKEYLKNKYPLHFIERYS
jgi:hypothetical protein